MIRILVAAIIGVAAALAAQLQTTALWSRVYVRFPNAGYEKAMASGAVPAYFTSSPAALLVSLAVLFVAAFLVLRPRTRVRPVAAATFWFTSWITLCYLGLQFPSIRESNMQAIGFLMIGFYVMVAVWVAFFLASIFAERDQLPKSSAATNTGPPPSQPNSG